VAEAEVLDTLESLLEQEAQAEVANQQIQIHQLVLLELLELTD
jgi:hypothetical protein